MKKQNKTAAEQVATLNKQFHAIERNLRTIKRLDNNDKDIEAYIQHGAILDAAFDKTLAALTDAGETVKFDNAAGEYILGANKFRFEYRVVSVGYVEIEAPTEQIAMLKAEKLADYDKIDLKQVSGELRNVTIDA